MTRILILCDYPCGKEVSDNVSSGKVPGSANAMGAVKTMQTLISFVVRLCRPAWNSHSEEQRWQPTFRLLNDLTLGLD